MSSVWSAATVPSLVGPLLSWISSRATMSGLLRLVTMPWASAGELVAGSVGSRFSTLYVATASSLSRCLRVVSRWIPPADLGAELGRLDHVAAEAAVVDRPGGDAGQGVADVDLRERPHGERDQRLDEQPPAVLLVVAAVERAARGRSGARSGLVVTNSSLNAVVGPTTRASVTCTRIPSRDSKKSSAYWLGSSVRDSMSRRVRGCTWPAPCRARAARRGNGVAARVARPTWRP